jgi:hypothetical protein
MKKPQGLFHHNVFINCPFDDEYLPIFHAVVFTVHLLGFRARCSKEIDDGGGRLTKIMRLIGSCKYGIHDLSRIPMPRFNMTFELGIDIGFQNAGSGHYRTKNHLIMDRHRYRYRKFISDLSGRDVKAHYNRPNDVINIVRDWLNDAIQDTDSQDSDRHPLPGGRLICQEYRTFKNHLPAMCKEAGLRVARITFNDYSFIVAKFIKERSSLLT